MKTTEKQVLEIRSRHAYKGINVQLAKEFNVKKSAISKIRMRRTWKHL